jgi:small subunit ribosomal protein S6
MFLLDTNKVAGDVPAAAQQVKSLLERNHAEILVARPWDERRLTYPIKNHKKGLYYLTYFRTEGKNLINIERDCALSELILRQLMIKIDPKLEEPMLAVGRDERALALQSISEEQGDGGRGDGMEEYGGPRRGGRRSEPAAEER